MTDSTDHPLRPTSQATDHASHITHHADIVRAHFRASAEAQRQAGDALAEGAAAAAAQIAAAFSAGHKVLICGNGGSAADAQHFAGEMIGRFLQPGRRALPMIALTTDTAVLTCVANDFSYEEVFSRQVEALAAPGDVVIGLTTSGRSPNVRRALRAGQARGARTIALTGGTGGPIAAEAGLTLCVPAEETTRIQECQITLIHALCDLIEAAVLAEDAPPENQP